MPAPAHVRDRLTLDRQAARQLVVDAPELASDLPDEQLDAAIADVDVEALFAQQRARWSVKLWDRKSPINGAPASHFLERGDVPEDGEVFLVMEGDRVLVFQPHDPDVEGVKPIARGKGRARGERQADVIAADTARAEAFGRLRAKLAQQP